MDLARTDLLESPNGLLAALLDQTDECIKLLDHDGRILFVNRGGAVAMELSSPSDLIGQLWAERWPEPVRAEVEAALVSVRRGEVARVRAARPGPDRSVHWWDVTVTPVRGAGDGAPRFLTIAREITAEITERQRVAAISAEMRHRLKNALSVASGLVALCAAARPEHREFAREICDRFASLSAAQDLLLDPGGRSFSQIVPLLASAYGNSTLLHFGPLPDVPLSEMAIQALALAFGELATNSLKYGALKHGRPVKVEGADNGGILHLSWCEETRFGAGREGGQGMQLIERLVRASGGTFSSQREDNQFLAQISLPIANPTRDSSCRPAADSHASF